MQEHEILNIVCIFVEKGYLFYKVNNNTLHPCSSRIAHYNGYSVQDNVQDNVFLTAHNVSPLLLAKKYAEHVKMDFDVQILNPFNFQ